MTKELNSLKGKAIITTYGDYMIVNKEVEDFIEGRMFSLYHYCFKSYDFLIQKEYICVVLNEE